MSTPPEAQAVAPKRQRGRDRVEAILEAATALFNEKPYEAVTMTEIAERSSTAIGSLYRFFPTKEALAAALLDHYGVKLIAAFDALIGSPAAQSAPQAAAGLLVLLQGLRRDRSVALGLLDAGAGLNRARGMLRVAMLWRLSALLRRLGASEPELETRALMLQFLVKAIFALPQDDLKLAEGLDQEAQAVLQGYLERATGT